MFGRVFPHEVVAVSGHMERSCESTGQEALPGQRAIAEGLRFPTKTMEARILWNNVFEVLKESKCHPRILYPVKMVLKTKVKIQIYSDEMLGEAVFHGS